MKYLFFASLLLLSACFEIKEEIRLNANGSGRYTLLLDLSASKNLLTEALAQDKKLAKNLPNFDSALIEGAKRLNEIKGISQAEGILNPEKMQMGMRFNFQNIKALNEALNENNDTDSAVVVYWLDGQTLTRNNEFHLRRLVPIDAQSEHLQKIEELLQQGNYTWILKGKKIKKSKNEAYQIGKDKNEIFLKSKILDLVKKKISVENQIKVKGF